MLQDYKEKAFLERIALGNPVKDTETVLTTLEGKPLDPSTVTPNFTRALNKAGLPLIRFRDLSRAKTRNFH